MIAILELLGFLILMSTLVIVGIHDLRRLINL